MLSLINPVRRPEPFDHPDWLFEAKFDGFRAAADTARGQLISRNRNRLKRFEKVLDLLPQRYVFDGSQLHFASGRLSWVKSSHSARRRNRKFSTGVDPIKPLRCAREIGCKADQVVVAIADDQTAHGPRLVARCLADASARGLQLLVQGVDVRDLNNALSNASPAVWSITGLLTWRIAKIASSRATWA